MIQLSAAGKRFGPKLLFQELDWLVTARDRAGIVGANGTGKSTLLKVLAGIESLDYGSLTATRGISTGYLPQDGLTLTGRTVFEECMQVFSGLLAMEKELETLTQRMSEIDPESAAYAEVKSLAGEVYEESLVGVSLEDRRVLIRALDAMAQNLGDGDPPSDDKIKSTEGAAA